MSNDVNKALQRAFEELADGLDLLGESSFRSASHRRVARAIGDLTAPIDQLGDDPAQLRARLEAIPGIGEGATRRILEFVEHGEIADHVEILERVPGGLFQLLQVPGLGPKAVRTLWQELGVQGVDDLRRELDSGRVESLPRMGRKTVQNLRSALEFLTRTRDRLPVALAMPLALDLRDGLRSVEPEARVEIAGSLRRGVETIGDLDLVAAHHDPAARRRLAEAFVNDGRVTDVLASGERKCSVRLSAGGHAIQADLRLGEPAAFGAALHYFTGSKEHNVLMRQIAIGFGRRLNEYGLFEGDEPRPQDHGGTPLAGAEEAELYDALGLPFIPAELREEAFDPARVGLEALRDLLARLIDEDQIVADLHTHSTASDGRHSLEELVAIARRRGLAVLAVTDHSRSSVLAGGLEIDALREHVAAIRELAAGLDDLVLLAGAEVDILPDGSLDYPDEVLAELDVVVASPHVSLSQDRATATRRLLAAIRNPHVHILGHPTGRIVGRRRGLQPDIDALCAAASEHGTALELNANPRRLDLDDAALRRAVEVGCLVAIDTDAHSDAQFGYLSYGVRTARRAGLPADSCVNTWEPERLRDWLADKSVGARGR